MREGADRIADENSALNLLTHHYNPPNISSPLVLAEVRPYVQGGQSHSSETIRSLRSGKMLISVGGWRELVYGIIDHWKYDLGSCWMKSYAEYSLFCSYGNRLLQICWLLLGGKLLGLADYFFDYFAGLTDGVPILVDLVTGRSRQLGKLFARLYSWYSSIRILGRANSPANSNSLRLKPLPTQQPTMEQQKVGRSLASGSTSGWLSQSVRSWRYNQGYCICPRILSTKSCSINNMLIWLCVFGSMLGEKRKRSVVGQGRSESGQFGYKMMISEGWLGMMVQGLGGWGRWEILKRVNMMTTIVRKVMRRQQVSCESSFLSLVYGRTVGWVGRGMFCTICFTKLYGSCLIPVISSVQFLTGFAFRIENSTYGPMRRIYYNLIIQDRLFPRGHSQYQLRCNPRTRGLLALSAVFHQRLYGGVQSITEMSINPSNADKFYNLDSKPAEERVEQRDPIDDLNPISLLKKPQQFKQAFFAMCGLSTEAFKSKNYERSAFALNKCVDMLDLGKNILKEINRFWKIVVYGNLACCYHYTRKLSKCNKFCEKIKEELERVIAEPPQKEVFLKLSRTLIKLKFQHCAILSQLEQHEKAFELCKSTLPMLKACIEMLLAYVQENSASDLLERKSSETVQFSRQVYKFAQTLLNDLLKCLNQPLKSKQRNVFYYWQKNPEQNEQQVKKKFIPHGENSNCKRSILGVSKSTHWIDQFNIGTIMHFSEMGIADFENNVPMEEYLFKDRLYELVIYCSMANFTMATELRLIESTQVERGEGGGGQGTVNLMKKYGYEQKSQLFKLSEIYHLRSIDIMSRNIKTTVPYITHIIRSYEKHYIKHKKVLEPIAAIVEESALSINESREERQKEEESVYYETTYNNYLHRNERVLEKGEDAEGEAVEELLLESQTYRPQQFSKSPGESLEVKSGEGKLGSFVEGASVEEGRTVATVRSDSNLLKGVVDSPGMEDENVSGEYLKSHRNKSSCKVKKSQVREKSGGRLPMGKPMNGLYMRDSKKETRPADRKGYETERGNNDYRMKTERLEKEGKGKERERKTIKKDKLLDFDGEKYGEKEIKIKTQSCTHIKVFYKKKK